MRESHKDGNYIMLSDGNLESLWAADAVAMAPLARKAATYARMTLEAVTPRPWDSHRQPAARTAFLLIGTSESEGEEIRERISQDQAHALFHWVSREFRESARSRARPLPTSSA